MLVKVEQNDDKVMCTVVPPCCRWASCAAAAAANCITEQSAGQWRISPKIWGGHGQSDQAIIPEADWYSFSVPKM